MKNIPFFSTEFGVASLTLQEIVYKKEAYIRIHSSIEPNRFIQECADFCFAAGAERIYFSGEAVPDVFPLYTRIISMVSQRILLPKAAATLIPVSEDSLEDWRSIYNDRMKNVPCSSTLTITEAQKLLHCGTLYFVHKNEGLIGIGKAENNRIDVIAACAPGAGKDVLLALNTVLRGNEIYVEVSDINTPAINLYHSLGFVESGELTKWFQYIPRLSNKNT